MNINPVVKVVGIHALINAFFAASVTILADVYKLRPGQYYEGPK